MNFIKLDASCLSCRKAKQKQGEIYCYKSTFKKAIDYDSGICTEYYPLKKCMEQWIKIYGQNK